MPSPEPAAARELVARQIPATTAGIGLVHETLADCWPKLADAPLPLAWVDECTLAVAEIAANIIQHAPEAAAPFLGFDLLLIGYPDHLEIRFIDRGVAARLPEAVVMPRVTSADELSEGGRGLALVRLVTDRVEYQRTADGSNVWTLEKRFLP